MKYHLSVKTLISQFFITVFFISCWEQYQEQIANGIAEIWVKIFSCKLSLLTEIYSPDIGALPKLQAQNKLILTPLWGVYSVQCFYLRANDQNLILAFNQMNSLFWHTKEEFSLNREDWSVVLPPMVFIYHFLFYNLGLEGERDNQ